MHGKNVFMDLDYSDPGLTVRKTDAERNLQSLNLKEGDAILDIIEEYRG